ncbi:hypothetical protein VSDG_08573 [Cytospora chrysosperma]|uniref:Uncharacterized protein n=1 Tax=Cytospora chrysosperma TaxID=252740 RepID=A0A423VFQ2_CYTCH|nr:hypothetical protein VSDG_08573 [Valsa sordida]
MQFPKCSKGIEVTSLPVVVTVSRIEGRNSDSAPDGAGVQAQDDPLLGRQWKDGHQILEGGARDDGRLGEVRDALEEAEGVLQRQHDAVPLGQRGVVLVIVGDGRAQDCRAVEDEEEDEEVLDAGRVDEVVELLGPVQEVETDIHALGPEVFLQPGALDLGVSRADQVRLERSQEERVRNDVELAPQYRYMGVFLIPGLVRPDVAEDRRETIHPLLDLPLDLQCHIDRVFAAQLLVERVYDDADLCLVGHRCNGGRDLGVSIAFQSRGQAESHVSLVSVHRAREHS